VRVRIWPYLAGSCGAQELRDAFRLLGHKAVVLRTDGSTRYCQQDGDLVVNWGSSNCPLYAGLLNHPNAVAVATSKTSTYRVLDDRNVPTLQWTCEPHEAAGWFGLGDTVYARRVDRGRSGVGIEVCTEPAQIPWSGCFYTRGVVGREYRVHVIKGRVVRVQKRYKDDDGVAVRSHSNGYAFISSGFKTPAYLREVAMDAVRALGLDFGAVDLINCRERGPLVLEVNTACGMEGSTSQVYAFAMAMLGGANV
jgi:hypothetical protein